MKIIDSYETAIYRGQEWEITGRSYGGINRNGVFYDLRRGNKTVADIPEELLDKEEITYVAQGGFAMPCYHAPRLVK